MKQINTRLGACSITLNQSNVQPQFLFF